MFKQRIVYLLTTKEVVNGRIAQVFGQAFFDFGGYGILHWAAYVARSC